LVPGCCGEAGGPGISVAAWFRARTSPGGTPSSASSPVPYQASSPVPLTRMTWLKGKLRATPAARTHPVSRMVPVNGTPGTGEQGWRAAGRRDATSPGLGATPRTSAAPVTFGWLIRASWWIACVPGPRINRRTRINHNNRRSPPPGVTPVAHCNGCDEQRQAEAVPTSRSRQSRYTLSSWTNGPSTRTGRPPAEGQLGQSGIERARRIVTCRKLALFRNAHWAHRIRRGIRIHRTRRASIRPPWYQPAHPDSVVSPRDRLPGLIGAYGMPGGSIVHPPHPQARILPDLDAGPGRAGPLAGG
jgi:hypothetical protein